MKTIMHVDMNSYFATAEQQANPYLRGRPIGIIKGRTGLPAGRQGCIIAASVEAKRFGVKTGSTVWEAKQKCPQIILVPSDMDKYFALTKRMISIISHYSPTIEIFSIDEAFLDVTDTQKIFAGGAWEIALEIKNKIKIEMGEWMKCSIGISYTKLLAKLASEMQKPDGLTFLGPEDYLQKTQNIAVEEICGIGMARTRYLHDRGVFKLGQARKLELPPEIADLVWLKNEEQLTTVDDLDPAKSVGRTFTAFSMLDTQSSILKLVRNLIEETAAKLREMGMGGRTLYLTLNPSPNLGEGHYTKTLKDPVCDPQVIFDLLSREYLKNPVVGIRKAGVNISNLAFSVQRSVFDKREKVLRVVDEVNEKYGLFTAYPASLLGGELIRPEMTGFLGDKWYRFGS
ncbi:MAG: polymerase IV protein [Candidatus Amesbacteria bacterium GW2011_GWA2_42_12]|uniref:Polymerase IV protein n=1 Tax=Candidatus Amesbacteria bacterium GW2011_GWA2_42_12 TaxID=1618356 RepID=A0A0G0Y743_9BACT|nr:MAG: polymerase IV protein [Candidatus Amesbacteria bacterium GW2011_GWA2_42_12]